MKQYLSVAAIFSFLLLAIPAVAFVNKPSLPTAEAEISTATTSPPVVRQNHDDVFLVLDAETDKILKIPARDYVIGAVSAEMPASFEPEALKAQAVAAYTYAVRQREKERISPTEELNGAHFSNDSTKYQAFFTEEQAKSVFGKAYEAKHSKVSGAVDQVLGEILVYGNEPIVAAFHSMSGGVTESAENVWGSPVAYLVPVESPEDALAPNFSEEVVLTPEEISARLTTAFPDIVLESDPESWFSVEERTASGTVTKLSAGNKVITGLEFRTVLNLRSANFEIEFSDKSFRITTKGYGHGVGLSQYGANAMALQGKSYEEILAHYYKGTSLKRTAAE